MTPSTIVDCTKDEYEVIRQGAGVWEETAWLQIGDYPIADWLKRRYYRSEVMLNFQCSIFNAQWKTMKV
jgi:hypothetical protein